MPEGRGQDLLPEAVLAVRALKPVQERDLALLDLVAELRQQRREHRQRAEHRDADDHHRGDAEPEVALVTGEDHPGHRDHHGEAGDENRPARGRCGGFDRGARALAGRPLLALALEVEERVVDADREADEQDDGADVRVHRDELAGQRHEPDRREHRGEREQQRHACGDDRAEHEQQHDDRDRDRPLTGRLQLVGEHLVDRLARARCACLADEEARMARGADGDAGLDRVDLRLRLICRALHVPRDDDRAAVLRDLVLVTGGQRRLEVLRGCVALDGVHDVVHGCAERGIRDRSRRALHDDELGLRARLRKALLEDLVGLLRLADIGVLDLQLLRADLHAEKQRKDNETEPTEDRCLPMARAPATHAGRDVL
jgi:hypothetical protein